MLCNLLGEIYFVITGVLYVCSVDKFKTMLDSYLRWSTIPAYTQGRLKTECMQPDASSV